MERTVGDFLYSDQIEKAFQLGADFKVIHEEIIKPNIEEIRFKLDDNTADSWDLALITAYHVKKHLA